jgi:enoyl-CoA hydratase/carnithine racemase
MGLEVNEFVTDVEQVFRISIPDEVAVRITTPRELARFIADQPPEAVRASVAEIEQAVLQLLEEHAYRARALTLDTHFRDIFP